MMQSRVFTADACDISIVTLHIPSTTPVHWDLRHCKVISWRSFFCIPSLLVFAFLISDACVTIVNRWKRHSYRNVKAPEILAISMIMKKNRFASRRPKSAPKNSPSFSSCVCWLAIDWLSADCRRSSCHRRWRHCRNSAMIVIFIMVAAADRQLNSAFADSCWKSQVLYVTNMLLLCWLVSGRACSSRHVAFSDVTQLLPADNRSRVTVVDVFIVLGSCYLFICLFVPCLNVL